jgi:HD-GYP domain-containing protein (c-di-GMP phosphodiesterase class II)
MNLERKNSINEFLSSFLPALINAQQYTVSHQLTLSSMEKAHKILLTTVEIMPTLALKVVEGRVIADEEPLEDSIQINRLLQFLNSKSIQHIRFIRGITLEEFSSFIELLTAVSAAVEEATVLTHVQFGRVALGFKDEDEEEPAEDELDEEQKSKIAQLLAQFKQIEEKDFGLMAETYDAIRTKGRLPEREINEAVTDIINAVKQGSSILMTFSPLRALDEYTFTHSTNVCILTLAQAMALKVKEELLHDIGVAAMMHDIGKLFVPEEILNKQGKLTKAEMDVIRLHPQKGAEYLVDKAGIPQLSIIVAYEHHMQYDHSGYPTVSPSWRQNICSQMCTIADFFDALRTKRVYRDSIETKIITKQMSGMAGKQLNPVLTKNFLILLKKLFDLQSEQQ